MTKYRKSRFVAALLAIIMALTLVTPALAAGSEPANDGLKIALMSDVHYISPTFIADTADYTHALNSDRKMLTQADAICDQLIAAVRADQPDVLLISGDLTKDGEQENHRIVSAKLQQLQKDVPGLKIYLINGNHDIRNSNAEIFSTPDGVAVPATRTHPQDFKAIYDFVYSDETVIATYTPPEGQESGSLSYVARPCEGYTVIAVDTCIYSVDLNDEGEDEHRTSGAISAELEQWVLEQIIAARARGDIVMGLEHHGLVPHFTMEPDVMPMYLVKNYDRISEKWANAGMSIVFTGHMHALDISTMTTAIGCTLYDIETGSALSYPTPVRFAQISRNAAGDTCIDVRSRMHFGPISYTEADGTPGYIDDITVFGKANGLSEDMLCTVAGSFLGDFLIGITGDSATATWATNKIVAKVQDIVSDLVNIPVADGSHTLLEAANYIYQMHLGGSDDGNYPVWVQEALTQVKSGQVLDDILSVIKHHAFGTYADKIRFDSLITRLIKSKINSLILDIADSFGNDTNFTSDIDAKIVIPALSEPEEIDPGFFVDVPSCHWAFDDILYVFKNLIFKGTTQTTFSPEETMTRGMIVTTLWRLEGEPQAAGNSFSDAQNIWCSDAIDWAAAKGIVNGFTDGSFRANDTVTREQIAMILYRYAGFKGADTGTKADISGFADFGSVSSVAREALSSAVAKGIILGNNNNLMPAAGATRAQVSAMLHRFIENCL